MGKRKKLEKAAKKAYKRADKAVDEAIRTAEKADRAAQKRARKLAERLADAAPDVSEAAGKPGPGAAQRPDSGASIDLTPPLPTAGVEDPDAERTPGMPPHDPELDHLTVQALRDVARSRDLRNVAHLTKAQLIERLSE